MTQVAEEREIGVGDAAELLRRRRVRDQPQVPGGLGGGVHGSGAEPDPRVRLRRGGRHRAARGGRRAGACRDRRAIRWRATARRMRERIVPADAIAVSCGREKGGGASTRRRSIGVHPWGGSAASIRCMRSISVVWSAYTSEANRKTVSSCAAPWEPNSWSTIVIAPWWCWIMNVRNSRSNSGPRARSSWASCSAVSMPGMNTEWSMPE